MLDEETRDVEEVEGAIVAVPKGKETDGGGKGKR